ncbi:hypothetical protein RGI145_19605 [Roseomonas gilardii]|uniref:Uncharacterized protein n=1 Tax=Roseomonas gilardii TaxID=257708 RepID=A0A1L7ALD1_9PROT|nr:hypothetical protein [Roseomonas gilardii]APT59554.1 hypothetical protein RGI145_19605 [Roseomonas gilardii]
MPTAAYANADSTDVALTRDDGTVVAVKPDDPRLEGVEIAPYAPDPVPVPQEVTRAQARVAMAGQILPDGRSLLKATKALIAGRLEAVESLPDSDPASIAAEQLNEWWESAATYRRDHPAMAEVAGQFGLSDAQVDALFRTAAAVS